MGNWRQQHASGPKVGKSHTSTTRIGKRLVNAAHELEQVTRIALCSLCHQGKRGIKEMSSHPSNTGLRIRVKSEGTIQDIHIVTNEPDYVLQTLTLKFPALQRTD